jgi:serine/threonine-protein kinase HipA
MAAGKCHLEIYVSGQWQLAAEVRCDDVAGGVRSGTRVEYDFDYLDLDPTSIDARDRRALSCRYPVGYGVHAEDVWPAFLLDIIPSGAARRYWEAQLGLPNTPSSDWAVLVAGGGNPPGNVRVQEAAAAFERDHVEHAGFARAEVLDRAEGSTTSPRWSSIHKASHAYVGGKTRKTASRIGDASPSDSIRSASTPT